MAELKTQPTKASVAAFLKTITPEQKRKDCLVLLKMMQAATKAKPQMWGSSIVGFGNYQYKYASGRAGEWFFVGFSPRAQNITVYIMGGLERHEALFAKLGKYKISGGSCLYLKKLADVDQAQLQKIIVAAVKHLKKNV